MNSERLVKWVFAVLTFLFIFFIAYASWTPADGAPVEGGLLSGFKSPGEMFRGHNLRDIATNVLLYMPLGVFLGLALSTGRPRFLSPWLFFGFAVSLTMELGQSFIGRTPDAVDLVTNTTGYALGYLIVVAAVRFYGLNALVFMGFSPSDAQNGKTQSIAAFRFIAICIYVLIALLPFDVSVKLSDIYAQLLPDETGAPRIILDPLYTVSNWQKNGLKLTFELWALMPLGALTAFLAGIRGRFNVFAPVFTCVSVAFFCELAQVCILSRRTDIVIIPLAVVAGLLGWILVRTWFRIQHVDTQAIGSKGVRWQELALALLGYALVIGLFAWSPFEFETNIDAVMSKIRHESNLVPFRQHFSVRSLGSAVDIVKEASLFVPFGLLCARLLVELRPQLGRLTVITAAAVVSGSFACFTELTQAVCVGRYIDVTDVFLGASGGLAGAVLLQLFQVRSAPKPHLQHGFLQQQDYQPPYGYQPQHGYQQQQPQHGYQQQQPSQQPPSQDQGQPTVLPSKKR